MRTRGTIGTENEDTIFYSCSPTPLGRNNLNNSGGRRASYAPDHFLGHLPFTTLTERVVDFLERYNKAIYGLG